MKTNRMVIVVLVLAASALGRNIDLSTVPDRDTIQLTIYNAEDLTLVRETRRLTFKQGANPLQFSWANTLIDPTSVEFRALTHADEVDVLDVSFPPRVTDTLEPETNLDTVEEVIGKVIDAIDGKEPFSPTALNRLIGKHLAENYPNERGILKSAYLHKVPVFVPAFVDSELGNDIYIHNIKRRRRGKRPLLMDLERDSKELIKLVTDSKRFGIFSIGGGVPRNNVQNVAPLIEIINERLGPTFPNRRFTYGVRICPDRPHFGHLSGCTYSENESWRKADKNGIYAEMLADATQVWPFLIKYLMERRAAGQKS